METTRKLPLEIQELLDAGTIRDCGDDEFVIDSLRHRTRTGYGWDTVIYVLRIEDDDEGKPSYDVIEQTESYGEDVIESYESADEAAYWITNSIEEMEE
jgi:hypothetical protein